MVGNYQLPETEAVRTQTIAERTMTRPEIDILLFGSVAAGIFWRRTLTRAEWEKIHPGIPYFRDILAEYESQ